MNLNQFTQKSLEAVQSAQSVAVENGNQQVGQPHLLLALLQQEDGLIGQLMGRMGVPMDSFVSAVTGTVGALPKVSGGGREADKIYISQSLDQALNAAKQQADTHVSVERTCYYQELAKAKGAVAEFMASVEAYNGHPEAFTYYKYISTITAAYKKGVLIIAGDGIDTGSLIIGDLSRPVVEVYDDIEPEVEEEYYE